MVQQSCVPHEEYRDQFLLTIHMAVVSQDTNWQSLLHLQPAPSQKEVQFIKYTDKHRNVHKPDCFTS